MIEFKNVSLKSLNISHNSFNSNGSNGSAIKNLLVEQLAVSLSHNVSLTKLDLSSNNFDSKDIDVLKMGLSENKTLLQLGFDNHVACIDSKGFMENKKYNATDASSKWIDDGWKEETFRIKIHKEVLGLHENQDDGTMTTERPNSMPTKAKTVCIHLSFDAWRADEMSMTNQQIGKEIGQELSSVRFQRSSSSVIYEIHRVCPPGKMLFFFSIGRHLCFADPYLPHIPRNEYRCFGHLSELPSECLQLNVQTIHKRTGPLELCHEFPRRPWCEIREQETDTITWKLENSIFKERKNESPQGSFHDSEEELTQAFEADWDHSLIKLQRIKSLSNPENLARLKNTCHSHYSVIREVFRYYAAGSSNDPLYRNDPYYLRWNLFTEFCQHSRLIDKAGTQLEVCFLFHSRCVFVSPFASYFPWCSARLQLFRNSNHSLVYCRVNLRLFRRDLNSLP